METILITLSGADLGGTTIEDDGSWEVGTEKIFNNLLFAKPLRYRRDSETQAVYVGTVD